MRFVCDPIALLVKILCVELIISSCKKVLLPAIDAINENTDIYVTYLKPANSKGRKINKIMLRIENKDIDEECEMTVQFLNQTMNIKELRERMNLRNIYLNTEQVAEVYSIAVEYGGPIDTFQYIRLNWNYVLKQSGIRYPYAYFLKCLREDLAKAIKVLSVASIYSEYPIRNDIDEAL